MRKIIFALLVIVGLFVALQSIEKYLGKGDADMQDRSATQERSVADDDDYRFREGDGAAKKALEEAAADFARASEKMKQELQAQIQEGLDKALNPLDGIIKEASLPEYMKSCMETESYAKIFARARTKEVFGPYAIETFVKEIDLLCRDDGLKSCARNKIHDRPPCKIDTAALSIMKAHFTGSPNPMACSVALNYLRLPKRKVQRACKFLTDAMLSNDPRFCRDYKMKDDWCPHLERITLGPDACPSQLDLDPRVCMTWALTYQALKGKNPKLCQGNQICLATMSDPSVCAGDSAPGMVALGKKVERAYCARKWRNEYGAKLFTRLTKKSIENYKEKLKTADKSFDQFSKRLINSHKSRIGSNPDIKKALSIKQIEAELKSARAQLAKRGKNFKKNLSAVLKNYDKTYGKSEVWGRKDIYSRDFYNVNQ